MTGEAAADSTAADPPMLDLLGELIAALQPARAFERRGWTGAYDRIRTRLLLTGWVDADEVRDRLRETLRAETRAELHERMQQMAEKAMAAEAAQRDAPDPAA